MKKSIVIVIILSAAVLFFISLKPHTVQKKYTPVSAREPEPQSELKDSTGKEIQLKKAKVILESQDWIISLKPLAAGVTKEEDVLTFFEGRVISRNLFSKGYPQVRYSLNFSQEGRISWEAVQESPVAGLVSWRGELKGESSMQGIVSLQAKNGSLEDFFFESRAAYGAPEPQKEDSSLSLKARNRRKTNPQ